MFATNSGNVEKLVEAIVEMPEQWALTPCVGKDNIWTGWRKNKLDRATLIEAIQSQKNLSKKNAEGKHSHTAWTGVSIVTGPMSGGIMAIDFDGSLAYKKFSELSGGSSYPTTKRWTSGKSGHFQILLSVPRDRWETLTATKYFILNPAHRLNLELNPAELAHRVKGGFKAEDIEKWESGTTSPIPPQVAKKLIEFFGCSNSELCQKLEFRWNECSTLPPSIHPDTGKPYIWKNTGEIAECPDFILDLMREAPAVELPKKPSEQNTIYIDVEKSLVDILENEILPRLDAEEFYAPYVERLKVVGKELKGLCPFHPEKTPSFTVYPNDKSFYCFGCSTGGGAALFLHQIGKRRSGFPRGRDFAEVVHDLANHVGLQMPDRQQPRTQNLKSNNQNSKPNNVLKHPANYSPEPAPAEEIFDAVDSLLADELTPAQQIVSSLAAAKRAGVPDKILRELLEARQAEQDLDWSLIQSRENFQRLYQIEKNLINLHEFFPHALAKALLTKAESDRVDPVRILQSLLPVVGATLGARIAIEVKKGVRDKDSWKEYPIFYCADVGPPSSGKSATQNTIIEPLQEMQDAEQIRADEALIEWGQLSDTWKSMSKEEKAEKAETEENPRIYHEKYCTPRKWLFDQGSAQALTKRIAEQEAQHGCLLMQDELSGFFDSFDQFTGGKGTQRQFILNAWNKPLRGGVDRVDLEASYFFKSQTLSITGTIQPDVARRVFNVATDADGMVSRFLPAIASLPRNFAKWSNVQVDIYDTMKGTIEKLRQLPECLLTMPPATKEIYIKHWESIRELYEINLHNNPAYAFWLGKQNSYVARFAIVLHCLENLNAAEFPTRVTPETMHKAVRLSQFYCSQFLLLQSKSAQQQPLEGLLLDILKFIQQSGGQISTRDLCRSRFQRISVEGKKLTTATAAKLLREIAAAGFGSFEETGNKKIFTLNSGLSSTVINCHQLDDSSKPSHSKDFDIDCHQMTKVYVPENFDSRDRPPSKRLIDESALHSATNSQNLEDIQFCHLMTVEAQTQPPQALEFDDSLMTVDDSDDSPTLNVDEKELLEMVNAAIKSGDPVLAKNVRGSLQQVCGAGHADRKKVWDALGSENQKIFLALLKTEIPSELVEVVEKIEKTLQTEKPFMVDDLRVFTPDRVMEATKFLKPTDKAKLSKWMAIRKLAADLVEAVFDGAVADVAAAHPADLVELAIARLEYLKEWDAIEEIWDVLGGA